MALPRATSALILAQAVATTGAQVTALALPTLAIVDLRASALAATALFATEFGAQALAGPLLGVLVDRVRRRRRLLVVSCLAYAGVLAVVPLAYLLGVLSLVLLGLVAGLAGVLSGLVGIGVQVHLAEVTPPDRRVEANAAVQGGRSVGQIAGPALAGLLVQVTGAALALLADGVAQLGCAIAYAAAGPARPARPDHVDSPQRTVPALREGLTVLGRHPALVRIAITGAALNFGGSALGALYLVFAYRELGLSAGTIGGIYVVSSVSTIVAVALAPRLIRRLGLARVVPTCAPIAGAALLLIPAASVLPAVPTLAVYEAVFGFCATVWFVATAALQQSTVPTHQLGRVVALGRTLSLLAIPVGALLAGLLAQAIGVTATMVGFAAVALAGGCVGLRGRSGRSGSGTNMPGPDGSISPGSTDPLTVPDGRSKTGASTV